MSESGRCHYCDTYTDSHRQRSDKAPNEPRLESVFLNPFYLLNLIFGKVHLVNHLYYYFIEYSGSEEGEVY